MLFPFTEIQQPALMDSDTAWSSH